MRIANLALLALCLLPLTPLAEAGDSLAHACVDWQHYYYDCYGLGISDDGHVCIVWWTNSDNNGDWEGDSAIAVCYLTCIRAVAVGETEELPSLEPSTLHGAQQAPCDQALPITRII